jgi:hypothetical protein
MTTVPHSPDPARPMGADRLPLLPRGSVVFEPIPLRAIVIDALTPVIGDGTLVVRDGERGAVILVRGGAVWEVHVVDGDELRTGSGLLKSIQGWSEASVSAERLDSPLVDLCATLLRGDTLYDDLRLMWVNWPSLLADLGRRGGTYVVEITTPAGRGVTCVTAGRQALSYTDIHPSLGDPALLEAMASNREGSVRVRRVGEEGLAGVEASAIADAAPSPAPLPAARPATQPAPAVNGDNGGRAEARPAPDDPLPGMSWVAPWETTWRPEEAPAPSGAGNGGGHAAAQVTGAEPGPSTWRELTATAVQAEPASAMARTDSTPTDDIQASADRPATALAAEPALDPRQARPISVAEVLDDLRSLARRRLQLSAPRVESVLDEGALERRPIESVLDEIRAMSIRGVMPATVEEMVDEMSRVVAARGQ